MKASVTNGKRTLGLVALAIAIGVAGVFLGVIDDAPGASLVGILLIIAAVAHGVRTARRRT